MQRLPLRTLFLVFLVALVILVPFFIWEAPLAAWFDDRMREAQGRPGLAAAVLFLLLASDIFLPVPSSLVSTSCGLVLGLWPGFLVSFMAMNVSAGAGYAVGRFSSPLALRLVGRSEHAALTRRAAAEGRWFLLVLRPVPVLAEASVVFSGLARQPVRQAVPAMLAGNAVVSLVYAAVGAYGRSGASVVPAFAATLLVSGLCLLAVRRR